jgi:hypothetical protein
MGREKVRSLLVQSSEKKQDLSLPIELPRILGGGEDNEWPEKAD